MKQLSSIDTNDQQIDMAEPSYTLKEVEDLTGLSVSTLRKRIKDGEIKRTDDGGKFVRISQTELDKLPKRARGKLSGTGDPGEEIKRAVREVLEEPDIQDLIRSIAKKK
ncbi:MAG: helix-turn-helix domain-containing protein [Methanomicrobiales archaeon]|nr:helix-turn-helix domain-containing protein [Methanomicrobiales archaeon]